MSILSGNLICTVGTSLFIPNLKYLNPEKQYSSSGADNLQAQPDRAALQRKGLLDAPEQLKSLLTDIKSAYETKDHSRMGALFTRLPPELRLLGAEINSIEAMVRKGFLPEDRVRLILLVSDTPDGDAIGHILTHYFQHRDCPIGFSRCSVETVKGLQDEKPLIFQKEGLTNLVRLLGDHYRRWGGAVAINATGGYKAQIALAVAFGQATGSPVYYKHERFDQIIRFPRIPFTLDLSPVRDHLKLWADMAEPGASFDRGAIDRRFPEGGNLREAIWPLLESVEEESGALFCLSALGMVYWEAFLSLHPDITLKPAGVNTRRGCHFPDDHYPVGFRDYVEKFYASFPGFVSECHSLPYSRQPAIKNRFYARENKIIGEYLDRNRFGARFEVVTAAENRLERDWLVDEFSKWIETQ